MVWAWTLTETTEHLLALIISSKGVVRDLCVWSVCCRQDGEAEVQRLLGQIRATEDRHKRELETIRQQCRSEVEEAQRQAFSQCETSLTLHVHRQQPWRR